MSDLLIYPSHYPLKIIHFETLGCRLNSADTEALATNFLQQGFELFSPNGNPQDVSLCVVNTCTVTSKAEQKCRRVIRAALKRFPNSKIIVTGCYAKLNKQDIEKISERIQCKDFVLDEINTFAYFSEDFLFHSRAVLKIQDGCNNACTYCKTTLARGASRSLAFERVIERAVKIEKAGYAEAVLTGVNICDYKSSIFDDAANSVIEKTLCDVIFGILAATKTLAIRLSSLHPEIVLGDTRFLEALKNNRVRPHFHFSVQSGSDAILQAMGRLSSYSRKDVFDAVSKIKKLRPGSFTACDIIVGFPGETEEDFLQTLELCTQCCFAHIHVFPFSPREGTASYSFKNAVSEKTKTERVKKLNALAAQAKIRYVQSFCNSTVSAVIEKRKENENYVRALSANFIHLIIDGDDSKKMVHAGSEQMVKITEVLEQSILSGEEAEARAVFVR